MGSLKVVSQMRFDTSEEMRRTRRVILEIGRGKRKKARVHESETSFILYSEEKNNSE